MSPQERLNYLVDSLVDEALLTTIQSNCFIINAFPFEEVRVFIGGKKLTGLTRGQLSHYWGEKVARKVFNAQGIVHSHNFDLIYWREMDRVMQSFPEMFHVFITKQVSHFCVTNIMLSIIDGTTKNQCPSCRCPDKTTTHITRCLDPGRSTTFLKFVKSIKDRLTTQKNWRPSYQLHHSISPCPWPDFNDSYHP